VTRYVAFGCGSTQRSCVDTISWANYRVPTGDGYILTTSGLTGLTCQGSTSRVDIFCAQILHSTALTARLESMGWIGIRILKNRLVL